MIGILDIGLGNNQSVYKLLKKFGTDYEVVQEPEQIGKIDKLIFPGVGSFSESVKRLEVKNLKSAIKQFILKDGHYLGICLGMQLLATTGHENEKRDGIGAVNADVIRLFPTGRKPLPHIGWNTVLHDGKGLFENIDQDSDFYFVHSYHMKLNSSYCFHECDYGGKFTAYVKHKNAHGVQFHPEKSQHVGQQLIRNFLNC
jgi:imidazole glycerol-phosphate synthase subunit HisH